MSDEHEIKVPEGWVWVKEHVRNQKVGGRDEVVTVPGYWAQRGSVPEQEEE